MSTRRTTILRSPRFATLTASGLLLACAAVLAALPPAAQAQYKVVGPDGRVTYTDRLPANATQAQPVALRTGAGAAPELPLALRQAVKQHAVTLYSGPQCAPCDAGRALLTQRGVPFTEKRVKTSADVAALQQLSGAANLPLLSVGQRQLPGLVAADWQRALDAAGYPAQSVLPKGWRAPAATPLATPAVAEAGMADSPPLPAGAYWAGSAQDPAVQARNEAAAAPGAGGVRF